ncbi:MAG TPA: hypothetical protein VG452_13750 [Egibacteraceae bacterium]|nr:hypothetical protein [Actinomycetota bacterium]HWB73272.1 hypothetical protein [Egibacteraceae bacterium]
MVEPDVLGVRAEHLEPFDERFLRPALAHRLRGDHYGRPRIVASGQLLGSEQLPGFASDLARLLAPPPA